MNLLMVSFSVSKNGPSDWRASSEWCPASSAVFRPHSSTRQELRYVIVKLTTFLVSITCAFRTKHGSRYKS
jgi:hypothetical protein